MSPDVSGDGPARPTQTARTGVSRGSGRLERLRGIRLRMADSCSPRAQKDGTGAVRDNQPRGHHRLVIDPAADNEPTIRCYPTVGSRPVGIMRRYERDADGIGWHDGLLMELLDEDLDQPR